MSFSSSRIARHFARGAFAALATILTICARAAPARAQAAEGPVTIYCSADEAFARPILSEFTKATSIAVQPLFDTEAGKTTGLVHRLLAERQRPRADVWWSSEIFGTMQLAEAGVLAPCEPPAAADIPAHFRDPNKLWTAIALRARVIIYDPRRTPRDQLPRTWADLADPRFKGRYALANPIFGTTRGHMATLHALWGEEAFRRHLAALRENRVRLTDGNAQSVLLVARGEVELAATDTDDVIVAQARGDRVEMHFPDLGDSPLPAARGTLWIPNSVALVAGAPNEPAARRLIDYLVSPGVEMQLAFSDSANLPVRRTAWDALLATAARESAVRPDPGPARAAAVPARPRADYSRLIDAFQRAAPPDYASAAARLRSTDALVREILLR